MAHEFYQPPQNGPFMCHHCHFFDRMTRCLSSEAVPKILKQFPARKLPDGTARVEPGGCCDDYLSIRLQ